MKYPATINFFNESRGEIREFKFPKYFHGGWRSLPSHGERFKKCTKIVEKRERDVLSVFLKNSNRGIRAGISSRLISFHGRFFFLLLCEWLKIESKIAEDFRSCNSCHGNESSYFFFLSFSSYSFLHVNDNVISYWYLIVSFFNFL